MYLLAFIADSACEAAFTDKCLKFAVAKMLLEILPWTQDDFARSAVVGFVVEDVVYQLCVGRSEHEIIPASLFALLAGGDLFGLVGGVTAASVLAVTGSNRHSVHSILPSGP